MKTLKPYHGIMVLALSLIILLGLSPFLGMKFGLYGSFMGELLFLAAAVGVVMLSKGSFKTVFPIHKPRFGQLFGAFLLWSATLLAGMIITLLLSYFFPEEVLGIGQGLGTAFTSVPFLAAFFIVAITPAICEEAVFRGVLLNSFLPLGNKWVIIIVSGAIFGAFHGSIWRFVPTALLGAVFCYIVLETGNLIYSVIFHCVNNGFSLIMLYIAQGVLEATGMEELSGIPIDAVPVASIGSYFFLGGMIPFGVYIGNYLIHRGQEGYRRHLFTKERSTIIIILAVLTGLFFVGGVGLVLYGFAAEPEYFTGVMGWVR